MCHRINSSILSRTGREGCYTLMLIYSNEELQEKKKNKTGENLVRLKVLTKTQDTLQSHGEKNLSFPICCFVFC